MLAGCGWCWCCLCCSRAPRWRSRRTVLRRGLLMVWRLTAWRQMARRRMAHRLGRVVPSFRWLSRCVVGLACRKASADRSMSAYRWVRLLPPARIPLVLRLPATRPPAAPRAAMPVLTTGPHRATCFEASPATCWTGRRRPICCAGRGIRMSRWRFAERRGPARVNAAERDQQRYKAILTECVWSDRGSGGRHFAQWVRVVDLWHGTAKEERIDRRRRKAMHSRVEERRGVA